ncbi:MAG: hypothetical protein A2107_03320 [Verrucomicrobia bacterium GWF2_62_7]|nr:MAG: hypothetical protein A2107_03320 [Verrucomicrobia bacterium GWF2_62_7]
MNILLPLGIAWVILGLVVILLAFKRKSVSAEEDDSLHLGGGAEGAVEHQKQIAARLAKLDQYGKVLTALLAVTGLILVILYGLQMWESSKSTGL